MERDITTRSLAVRLIETKTGEPFLGQVKRRREQGMSYRAIGREFGISAQTIWRCYREAIAETAHEAAR
jgi:DNA invertase Pin-like site-specific DNA recombinase